MKFEECRCFDVPTLAKYRSSLKKVRCKDCGKEFLTDLEKKYCFDCEKKLKDIRRF
jgi:hypothetical protein